MWPVTGVTLFPIALRATEKSFWAENGFLCIRFAEG
jgi:hypothetical protein